MKRESEPIGQFYVTYVETPKKPIKTMDDVWYARNWANKVCKSQKKVLCVYQYIYATGESVRLFTVAP
jgi:hypothetical protein